MRTLLNRGASAGRNTAKNFLSALCIEHTFDTVLVMGTSSGALAELEAAVDALLAEAPCHESGAHLHADVISLQRIRAKLGVLAAATLSEWDHALVWAEDGSRSAASRLARDTHSSVRCAKQELRRARQLCHLPVTRAAVTAGDLSLEHLDLLGSACTRERAELFAEHEATLIDQCTVLAYAEAVRLVQYWCQRADDVLNTPAKERRAAKAAFYASSSLDGMVVLNGQLDPIGGAIVTEALRRIEHELYLADLKTGTRRTAAQRRAQALVEMAHRSQAAPPDGRMPKPLFTVVVGDRTAQQLCELANGTVIRPSELVEYFDAAMLETVLFDGPSTVLSVSRRRSFTGAIRRAIEVRDRRCQHPSGCDEPAARCDVDHIKPYRLGGVTSQFNGRLLCSTHNRHANKRDEDPPVPDERIVTRLDEFRARIRWRETRNPVIAPAHWPPGAEIAEFG